MPFIEDSSDSPQSVNRHQVGITKDQAARVLVAIRMDMNPDDDDYEAGRLTEKADEFFVDLAGFGLLNYTLRSLGKVLNEKMTKEEMFKDIIGVYAREHRETFINELKGFMPEDWKMKYVTNEAKQHVVLVKAGPYVDFKEYGNFDTMA
ncbi:hypothetical protein PRZ48_011882 [Zasmidium cellare]|uniref:Uncharacterized protein n=1 Tax=Zasmidium cellare TaxID=395010 RepID=A0ABR0E7M6_ZASCE|nr:hypothetical protein PRZ48_011882 [Zasmidium cellare]